MKRPWLIITFLLILYEILFLPVFINTADHYAVIARGDEVIRVFDRAGVFSKFPGPGKRVILYDKGIYDYTAEPSEIITRDQRSVTLVYTIRWRITDAAGFYRSNEKIERAEERIDDIVYFELRQRLVMYDYSALDEQSYKNIMQELAAICSRKTADFAVFILEIDILASDLTPEGEQLKNLRHLPYL